MESPETAASTRRMRIANELLDRLGEIHEPTVFNLLGLDWDLLPDVWAPYLAQCSALYAEWLPYPVGGSLCEVGCGNGINSVIAALRGCAEVTAIDINPSAVENTRMNAERHGVADRVRVLKGDVYSPLSADDRFDLIFWSSAHIEVGADWQAPTASAHAFFDPDLDAHARYLREGLRHLNQNGRLLLGFTDLGDTGRLAQITEESGLRSTMIRGVRADTPQGFMHFQLLEFQPAG